MTSFRTAMIVKPRPKAVKALINSIIPPKGTKKEKNITGIKLLDGGEVGNDASDQQNYENDIGAEQLSAPLSEKTATTSEEPIKENNSVIGETVSLAGITDNEDIEKDARVLVGLRRVFELFETSTQFTSARQ